MLAARTRFRPIVMTSLAFSFGVLPLALANGAGSGAQNAIGTGVVGGMVASTLLGILFVPVFFVVILRLFKVQPTKLAARRPVADGGAGGQGAGLKRGRLPILRGGILHRAGAPTLPRKRHRPFRISDRRSERLYRDRRLDRGVRTVADDLEVVVAILEQARGPPLDHELRQRQRLARELLVRLLEVVQVQVAIAAGPDELARP